MPLTRDNKSCITFVQWTYIHTKELFGQIEYLVRDNNEIGL